MSHSLTKIWIHTIWATKERYPLIQPSIEKKVHNYMATEFLEVGAPARIINGMPDHIHCLFLLNSQKSLSEIIKQVKGGTAYWINEQNLIKEKFSWQTGYAAYSVSESAAEKVFLYILNQKKHHSKTIFTKEYDEFIKIHGLQNKQA
ncbi:MAG: IS200/IS605 family transposase [Chitinophagaceae bacterium]